MYNRIYKFFNDSDIIYPLQVGFRQKYSTFYAISSLTEEISRNLDTGNIDGGIFVDLQKAFDTVEHNILLAKLEHYGILGTANNWFKSYLFAENNLFLLIVIFSNQASVKYVVPQSSFLGPLLFLIHINNLNQAIKFCKVHYLLVIQTCFILAIQSTGLTNI